MAQRLGVDPRALVGVAALIAGGLIWGLAFVGGGFHNPFAGRGETVKADFESVGAIVTKDPVRIHGVDIGRVSKIKRDSDGRGGTLTLDLDKDAGKIYKDASASILWRTALGANEAVALDPGTSSAGRLGDTTIPQAHTSNQVELDQVIQSFHDGAQPGLQTMLKQLGPALSQPQDLKHALEVLTQVAPTARVGIGALRGQVKDVDLKDLIRNAGKTVAALDAGTSAYKTRGWVAAAAKIVNAIDPHDLAVLLQRAPNTLPPLGAWFAHVHKTLPTLDPYLPPLTRQVEDAPRTLRALRPTLVHTHTLLRNADPLLAELRPTTHSLEKAADKGVPVIRDVKPSLVRLSTDVLPGLRQKYPEENLEAYKTIGSVFVGLGTLSNFVDENGELANLTAGLEEAQAQQFIPCTLDFSGTNFIVCQSLNQALSIFFSGGSKMLARMAQKPGAAHIYQPLLKRALNLESKFNETKKLLADKRPALAKLLFGKHTGAQR